MQGNRRLLGVSGVRCALHPGWGGGPWLHCGRHGRTEGRNHRVGPRGCLRSPASPCSALSKPCAAPPRGWHTPGHQGTPLGEAQDTRGLGGGAAAQQQPSIPSLQLAPVPRAHRVPTPQQGPRVCIGIWFNFPRGLT